MTPFDIHIDWSRRIIRMTIRGYWEAATFVAFAQALEAAEHNLRSGARFSYLCDAQALRIQSKDIGELWTSFLGRRDPRGLRTAIVVSTALSRLQIERVGATATRRVFDSLAEALDWLGSGDPDVSLAP